MRMHGKCHRATEVRLWTRADIALGRHYAVAQHADTRVAHAEHGRSRRRHRARTPVGYLKVNAAPRCGIVPIAPLRRRQLALHRPPRVEPESGAMKAPDRGMRRIGTSASRVLEGSPHIVHTPTGHPEK